MIHRMNLAALFFMAVLLLTGCTNKEKTDFSKYITGYTSGVIKSSSSLSVYLGQRPIKVSRPVVPSRPIYSGYLRL